MDRQTKTAMRAGATAVGAAAGMMLLASTGQTPSGFVPASFGGPLGIFDRSATADTGDVLAIGDGKIDAKDLATLLETTGPAPVPAGPMQAAASTPAANAAELALLPPVIEPASAPISKKSLDLKPVLDGQGRVDCSKAVRCDVDPTTNTTTVTFSDGIVAVVTKINDLTLVAYKTLGDVVDGLLPNGLPSLPAAATPAVIAAPPAPTPAPSPSVPTPARTRTATESTGPVAPSTPAAPGLSASDVRPTLTISKPPIDFDAPRSGGGSGSTAPKSPDGALDTVRKAWGSVVDSVTDAVKSLGPGGATSKPNNAPAE